MRLVLDQEMEPFLPDVIELDERCFSSEYVTSFEKLSERYQANPRSFVALMKREDLVGYVNLFPVCPSALEALRSGEMTCDVELEREHILPWSKREPTDLYIITIAVCPDQRGGGVTRTLIEALKDRLKALKAQGYLFNRVFAAVVTEDGARCLSRLSFEPEDEESPLWVAEVKELLSA